MPLMKTVIKAERHGGERARRLAETQLQIAGHRVRFGDVIERHHHDAEEKHRGNGADPIPVGGQDAVLIRGGGPAHQFERAQIGGQETEARDPGGHVAAGQEEFLAGVGESLR